MIISRKAEPGKKFEIMRYGIIGLAKSACSFRQVVFDVKVHDLGLAGFPSVPTKVAGIKVAGNRFLAPSKLDHYQHEIHLFVQSNSYGPTHL